MALSQFVKQISQPLCESVASNLLCAQVLVFKCISIQILFGISLFAVVNTFVTELWTYIFLCLVFQFKNAADYLLHSHKCVYSKIVINYLISFSNSYSREAIMHKSFC